MAYYAKERLKGQETYKKTMYALPDTWFKFYEYKLPCSYALKWKAYQVVALWNY